MPNDYVLISAMTGDHVHGVEVSDPDCPIDIQQYPDALDWATRQGWGPDASDELIYVQPAEDRDVPDGFASYLVSTGARACYSVYAEVSPRQLDAVITEELAPGVLRPGISGRPPSGASADCLWATEGEISRVRARLAAHGVLVAPGPAVISPGDEGLSDA